MAPLAAAWLGSAVAAAAPAAPPVDPATASLVELQQEDLRVATVAFRLLAAGVAVCAEHAPQSGLLIHDVRQYAVALRPAAVRLFRFAGRPTVLVVVPGSPADRAGVQPGDTILAVDGTPILAEPAPEPDDRSPSFDTAGRIDALLSDAFARGAVSLMLRRDGTDRTVEVDPVSGCVSTVDLQPTRKRNAWSDGQGVAITSGIVGEVASDDELATVIGHELAHNILHHRERLDARGIGSGLLSRIGPKALEIRRTEQEADYVGLYLVALAGYDPKAAITFWQRFGTRHGDGLLPDATHPGWRERVELLSSAADEIAAKRARRAPVMPNYAPASGDALP